MGSFGGGEATPDRDSRSLSSFYVVPIKPVSWLSLTCLAVAGGGRSRARGPAPAPPLPRPARCHLPGGAERWTGSVLPAQSRGGRRDVRADGLFPGGREPPPGLRLSRQAGPAARARVDPGGAVPALVQQGPAVQRPGAALPPAPPAGTSLPSLR